MAENSQKTNIEIGIIGENMAIDHLIRLGYDILARNWRYKKAEIDIIAKENDCLIFVEVKSKTSVSFGQPEEAIDQKKEAMLIDAAQRYMESIDHNWEVRFDIISILLSKTFKLEKISHFKDAFF